ncbi:uncharacterized protein LOC119668888 isoform X1 [Teleopsis dalmanni]|uniref:uncharacterized protein LOC119668888 isoform X1 n=1 Tax=Teleopsis dalmanni TaxID=139649 RepID=UPI0018CECB4E|nr:uncharacterized protein LOC119668888 isoform X1 [Teleopsis dalmanni]XP_037934492.1 uncharacterized protein LOC119668888 isoform X1 [Teleopsis dalmanni]
MKKVSQNAFWLVTFVFALTKYINAYKYSFKTLEMAVTKDGEFLCDTLNCPKEVIICEIQKFKFEEKSIRTNGCYINPATPWGYVTITEEIDPNFSMSVSIVAERNGHIRVVLEDDLILPNGDEINFEMT